MGNIGVYIVGQPSPFASRLALRLGEEPDVDIVGTGDGSTQVVEAVMRLRPQVVLLETDLNDQPGVDAVKGLNVSITRYPGGNFVSNYHWLEGVGPERIPRMELAWARLESNTFGTDESLAFAREIGTVPYFAVHMGNGTIGEAQRWAED